MNSATFQVGPQTFVVLRVQVFDAEGEPAGEPEVVPVVAGMGQMLPKVEAALDGRRAGERLELVLGLEDAYGPRNAQRIIEVDRGDFPEDVHPGDRFELENLEGDILVVHVLDVQPDCVVLDTNHPLAGQEVKFALEIQEVRPATPDEIAAAEAVLEEQDVSTNGENRDEIPHVRASRLIRGPSSR